MRLQGLKCVVTGGASGIGAATARRFAGEGAEVCILDRDLPAAQALAVELGQDHCAIELDVRLEPAVEQAAGEVGVDEGDDRVEVGGHALKVALVAPADAARPTVRAAAAGGSCRAEDRALRAGRANLTTGRTL